MWFVNVPAKKLTCVNPADWKCGWQALSRGSVLPIWMRSTDLRIPAAFTVWNEMTGLPPLEKKKKPKWRWRNEAWQAPRFTIQAGLRAAQPAEFMYIKICHISEENTLISDAIWIFFHLFSVKMLAATVKRLWMSYIYLLGLTFLNMTC